MLAYCHGCGHQQVQPLIRLRQWHPCCCINASSSADQPPPLAISGPLWIGALQDCDLLAELAAQVPAASLSPEGSRLLARLASDPGLPARCWPTAEMARRLGGGPPPLAELVAALRAEGWVALASGLMPGQFRSDAPWAEILQIASRLGAMASGTAK